MIVFPSRKSPATSLGGGGGYSAEAQQFFDRIGDPGTARKNLYAACIDALVSAGVWPKLDVLYLLAADSSANALVNLKQSSFDATAVNSPTFTADRGYQGDGSTSYLDTNFNPTTASSPNYTQNSACFFVWIVNNAAANQPIAGRAVGGNDHARIYPRYVTDQAFLRINGGSGVIAAQSDSRGLISGNRSSSSAIALYKDGSSIASSSSDTSIALPNINHVVLKNESGFNGAHQAACYGCGASLDGTEQAALYNALLPYMQGVGVV